jgi:nucleoid-associated protein Lsr2
MGRLLPPNSVGSQLPAVKAVWLPDAPAARLARAHLIPRERSGDIRAWANGQGIPVSERGRIPAGIVEQHEAAAR